MPKMNLKETAEFYPQDVQNLSVLRFGFSGKGPGLGSALPRVLDPKLAGALRTGDADFDQSLGVLTMTSGVQAGADVLMRSRRPLSGKVTLSWELSMSQRIANTTLLVMLGDLVGEGLSYTVNSATSITVQMPNVPVTAQNVDQFMFLGGFSGPGIDGRYQITAVNAATREVTFAVTGFPTSGGGTCTVFGHNAAWVEYSGTNAGLASVRCQRNGHAEAATAVSINGTAAPGHQMQIALNALSVQWADGPAGSGVSPDRATRASLQRCVPLETAEFFVWVVLLNGSAAPASSTTVLLSMLTAVEYSQMGVTISDIEPQGSSFPLPVKFPGAQQVTDVPSAALTATATTGAFTPSLGNSYQAVIPVTAVSGTNPTLDVSIEESDDGGTNWFKVYDFPRITSAGVYRSPRLVQNGNRRRYVQTVGGTSPSFTRAILALLSSAETTPIAQMVDRTLAPNTLNSVTPVLNVANCTNLQLVVSTGILTTANQLQIEGSDDGGVSWYAIGAPLVPVASSTVRLTVNGVNTPQARVRNSTAGTGVTSNYVALRGF